MYQFSFRGFIFITLLSCQAFSRQKTQLTVDEFEKGIGNANSQLLDVRTAGEFRSGHIAHALQADWTNQDQFHNRVQHLDKTKPLYVYCASGGRSKAAAQWFRSNGYNQVYELTGGFIKWKAADKPVEGMPNTTPMSWSDYRKTVGSKGLTLVDIGADWCAPCRKMAPVLEQLQQSMPDGFKLLKIDAGIETTVIKEAQAAEFPTFILYKNGGEVWRKQGIVALDELKSAIQKYQ